MARSSISSPEAALELLRSAGYLADDETATSVFLAATLGQPLLIEGPAGVGKTELAKSVAEGLERRLIRLQCYEGLDESRALYEWNYRRQLLRIQADAAGDWKETAGDIFSEEFLLERPLLSAVRARDPVVLLIDEVDRLDLEAEALMLEVLSDWQVSIPELGTVQGTQVPWVVLTSNATRELSEALKRRCLFLPMTYPSIDRERDILVSRVPGLADELAAKVAEAVRALRSLDLKKPPSISESIDWARTLAAIGAGDLAHPGLNGTWGALLKHPSDIDKAKAALGGG